MARQPDPRKQQHWLNLVHRWRQSQLTVRAFCDRHRLNEANFYLWRRILRERGLLHDPPARTRRASEASIPSAFVRLTVDASPAATNAIELVLSDQRLLRVRPGFDPATLRQLLRVLEEPAC
jgi:transposase